MPCPRVRHYCFDHTTWQRFASVMSPSLRHELSENNTFVSPVPVVIPGCVSQDFWLHIIEINWISSLKPKRTNHVFTHGTSSQFSKTGQSCAWTLQGISQELCTKPWGVSVEEGRGEEGRAGRIGGGGDAEAQLAFLTAWFGATLMVTNSSPAPIRMPGLGSPLPFPPPHAPRLSSALSIH